MFEEKCTRIDYHNIKSTEQCCCKVTTVTRTHDIGLFFKSISYTMSLSKSSEKIILIFYILILWCHSECTVSQNTVLSIYWILIAVSRQRAPYWHRVGRVLSFFFSRRNWNSPNPSPAGECAFPLWFWGEGHTRWRERGWESPNSHEGTYTVVLYIWTLWVQQRNCILCIMSVTVPRVTYVIKSPPNLPYG